MVDGHPLIWAVIVAGFIGWALGATDPWVLCVTVLALAATGLLATGERMPAFIAATRASLAAAVLWGLWTILAPSRGGASLLTLPTWSAGTGAEFGGTVGTTAVIAGVAGAFRAAAVFLVLGLAGQFVGARGWMALARGVLGPLAPAAGWIACAGEATVARRGTPGAPWFETCREIAQATPGRVADLKALRWGDLHHLPAVAALVVAWVRPEGWAAAVAAGLIALATGLRIGARRA